MLGAGRPSSRVEEYADDMEGNADEDVVDIICCVQA